MARLTNIDRARAVGHLQAGMSQIDVAQQFGVSQQTISHLWRKYRQNQSVEDRPRSGRPRATSPRTDRRISTLAARRRFVTARQIQAAVQIPGRRRVSDQTVRNRLHAARLWARRPYRVPDVNAHHRRQRLAWCRHRRRWTRQQWNAVLFSDESRFSMWKCDGRQRVWRRNGERRAHCCRQTTRSFNGGSVMVWAGISFHQKTPLVFIEGNLNAQQYVADILQPVVLPTLAAMGQNALYQDDNARPHRARIVADFHRHNNIQRMEWPACSPDLSPIENLWDQLGQNVKKRLRPGHNVNDLRRFLRQEWGRIPQRRIQQLILSMRRRVDDCIREHGSITKY